MQQFWLFLNQLSAHMNVIHGFEVEKRSTTLLKLLQPPQLCWYPTLILWATIKHKRRGRSILYLYVYIDAFLLLASAFTDLASTRNCALKQDKNTVVEDIGD